MDAFVSHSSKNNQVAAKVAKGLKDRDLDVRVDLSDIRLGGLLGPELQSNIRASRAVILLWSEDAAASRWVNTEWIMAIHEKKFIVPCTLDETALPQCLQNSVYLSLKADVGSCADRLARAVTEAPAATNPLAPFIRAEEPALKQIIMDLDQCQKDVLEQLEKRDLGEASKLQRLAGNLMKRAEKVWRFDSMIANLGGYHRKNEYMLKHWDAIQAGRAPKDPLLDAAERRYFDSLSVNQTDPSALNGIGNVFFFGRYLCAAESFHLWAIKCAEEKKIDYPAAEHDLQTVRYFKAKALSAKGRGTN